MLILRKIFSAFFIISMLIIENISAAMLDLPGNTPGLMKDKQKQKVCDQNKECVHIIVPATEADVEFEKVEYKCDKHQTSVRVSTCENCIEVATTEAKKKQGNIYFPADGVQPTTEEAAEYSCAQSFEKMQNGYVEKESFI